MDNRRVGEPQDDEIPRLASEDTSTGLEEGYAGGQGPHWTVALD